MKGVPTLDAEDGSKCANLLKVKHDVYYDYIFLVFEFKSLADADAGIL